MNEAKRRAENRSRVAMNLSARYVGPAMPSKELLYLRAIGKSAITSGTRGKTEYQGGWKSPKSKFGVGGVVG